MPGVPDGVDFFRRLQEIDEAPAPAVMIEPEMAKTQAAVDRFFSEAHALARLRHDNVVQIYAFGKHELSYFFAMDLEEEAAPRSEKGARHARDAHALHAADHARRAADERAESALAARTGRSILKSQKSFAADSIVIASNHGRCIACTVRITMESRRKRPSDRRHVLEARTRVGETYVQQGSISRRR